ncbi:hypothetical protein C0V97_03600 [Asaia sp. W19]|uniref:DUF1828 domain-containing protein n=1 Tax=unclassified Asaia TaxID=2685023 RepID=UPI000F8E52C4|nr:DUF1828 domain-containing protein [Asaia sp. W19]RUT26908.1 hypothetical protein C0V97_03600 [Asaia sp. W19]
MNAEYLKKELCRAFCSELSVHEVPAGLAFSGLFEDLNGDRVSGYLIRDRENPYLTDDGSFLSDLESVGIDTLGGTRAKFLASVLATGNAFVDHSTMTIRTPDLDSEPSPLEITRFLSALVRAQDVAFWSKERVKSTFAEDFYNALDARVSSRARLRRNATINDSLMDFPADILLEPYNGGIPVAMFLAQTVERLNEATLLAQEMRIRGERAAKIAAVSDTGDGLSFANRKVARALNRIEGLIVYRQDEEAALDRIVRLAELPVAA